MSRSCKARQLRSGDWECLRCGTCWDRDDEKPECRDFNKKTDKASGDRYLAAIREKLK